MNNSKLGEFICQCNLLRSVGFHICPGGHNKGLVDAFNKHLYSKHREFCGGDVFEFCDYMRRNPYSKHSIRCFVAGVAGGFRLYDMNLFFTDAIIGKR